MLRRHFKYILVTEESSLILEKLKDLLESRDFWENGMFCEKRCVVNKWFPKISFLFVFLASLELNFGEMEDFTVFTNI